MAVTSTEVKIYLGIPSALTKFDATITAQIDEAQFAVIDDGIGSSHAVYDRAVLLKTSVLIAATPLSSLIMTNETDSGGSTGEIQKEKVADVETTYFQDKSGSGSSGGASGSGGGYLGGNYERDYIKLINHNTNQGYRFGLT